MNILYFFLSFSLLVTLGGCLQFKPVEDPTRYYVLAPVIDSNIKEHKGKVIGINKIHVSNYLSRHELMIANGPNEMKLSPFHRWAEPFDKMIVRVLSENLSGYLGSNYTVISSPYHLNEKRDYEVSFQIEDFHGVDSSNEAYLFGFFQLKDNNTGEILKREDIRVWKPIPGEDYDDLAYAMSESLGDATKIIGDTIKSVSPS